MPVWIPARAIRTNTVTRRRRRLIIGATLAADDFGPARKRLRAVKDAPRLRIRRSDGAGAGAGGDEVAAVAAAFNAMASDLAERAGAGRFVRRDASYSRHLTS